jgi:hypothetical protein
MSEVHSTTDPASSKAAKPYADCPLCYRSSSSEPRFHTSARLPPGLQRPDVMAVGGHFP